MQLGDSIKTGATLRSNYNVAPTQECYVITNEQPDELQLLTWGLVPFWSKGGKKSGRMINARAEGIADKPSFRSPIRKRRCLVIADSFYEWQRKDKAKIPQRIFMENGELLVMAGIWETWNKGDQPLRTYSIITTEPNSEMQPVHNRMPVILDTQEKRAEWLHTDQLENALALLTIPRDGLLDMYAVSTQVNSVRNNSPQLREKYVPPQTLF